MTDIRETLDRSQLIWHGPFHWYPDDSQSLVFRSPVAKSPGVYLYGVQLSDGFLVNYVGKSDRTLRQRLKEDLDYCLDGHDTVAEPDEYLQGRYVVIYNGKTERSARWNVELDEKSRCVLSAIQVYFTPITAGRDVIERIEEALRGQLANHSERTRQFLANKRKRQFVATQEYEMIWPTGTSIIGLPIVLRA